MELEDSLIIKIGNDLKMINQVTQKSLEKILKRLPFKSWIEKVENDSFIVFNEIDNRVYILEVKSDKKIKYLGLI
ncbi:MAG: hypothetical protein GYA51_03005 [Candidatus Methanofastidiosa archaeon]|nr:hypothetical protein [Candidatus Methanofastidiosa archaeon]